MNENYAAAWEEYRRRRRLFWIVFAAYIPTGLIVVPLLAKVLPRTVQPGLVFFSIWGIIFIVTSIRVEFWRCPRCHKHFFRKWWGGLPFVHNCVHCGLPKFATTDDEEEL